MNLGRRPSPAARYTLALAVVGAPIALLGARADAIEPGFVAPTFIGPGFGGARQSGAGKGRRPGDDTSADDEDEAPPELELSLDFASAYVFRGYNVFQDSRQREQKWVQRPRIVWTPFGAGLSLGYAAANQLNGDNVVDNVAAGLGAEQDLFASYDYLDRRARLGVETELALVGYPASEREAAGSGTPVVVSLSVEPHYRHNVFLYLGYLRGFRQGLFEGDQGYINPRVEERFPFGDSFELELQAGVGMKILQGGGGFVRDNMFDVLATATLYYALTDVLYVGVDVGWAWTNLTARPSADTGQTIHPRFADEYVPFWGISVGAEFAAGRSASAAAARHHAQPM